MKYFLTIMNCFILGNCLSINAMNNQLRQRKPAAKLPIAGILPEKKGKVQVIISNNNNNYSKSNHSYSPNNFSPQNTNSNNQNQKQSSNVSNAESNTAAFLAGATATVAVAGTVVYTAYKCCMGQEGD